MGRVIEQLGKSTPEEKEILNITLEECSEVVQCISKIFRFGWDSCNPDKPNYTNRQHLTEEIGDLICMVGIMHTRGIIDINELEIATTRKLEKLKKFSNLF